MFALLVCDQDRDVTWYEAVECTENFQQQILKAVPEELHDMFVFGETEEQCIAELREEDNGGKQIKVEGVSNWLSIAVRYNLPVKNFVG